MTRGELMELAFQAGLATDDLVMPNGFAEYCRRLERFAALVAAAEREACASLCESLGGMSSNWHAESIRARGKA